MGEGLDNGVQWGTGVRRSARSPFSLSTRPLSAAPEPEPAGVLTLDPSAPHPLVCAACRGQWGRRGPCGVGGPSSVGAMTLTSRRENLDGASAEGAGRARRRQRLCPQGRSSAKAPCRDPSMAEAAGELQGAGGGQPHTQPTLVPREPGPGPRFSHSLPNAGLRSGRTGQAQLLPTALWGDKSPWQVRGLSPSRSISQGPSQAPGAGGDHALLTPAEEPSFTIRNSRILPAYSMMAPVCRLGAGRNSGGLVVSGSI